VRAPIGGSASVRISTFGFSRVRRFEPRPTTVAALCMHVNSKKTCYRALTEDALMPIACDGCFTSMSSVWRGYKLATHDEVRALMLRKKFLKHNPIFVVLSMSIENQSCWSCILSAVRLPTQLCGIVSTRRKRGSWAVISVTRYGIGSELSNS